MISRSQVAEIVAAEGLKLLGIVSLQAGQDYERFAAWLGEGRHASMDYLEKYLDVRQDPQRLLPDARCALVVALPYQEGEDVALVPGQPRIAAYARYADYHKQLRKKCELILASLKQACGKEGIEGRVLVDTAPLLERALAARTQAGFVGKNTCYIHPQLGSFLLLAEVLLTAELPLDIPAAVDPSQRQPEAGGCGTCKRCQVHCPTGALDKDYQIDARKCLAYWTIEHRGVVPEEYWPWFAKYWFGCDICQNVCPYNRDTPPVNLPRKLPAQMSLAEVVMMDQAYYELHFGGTPMTRAKREGLRRNALIAMAATKDARLPDVLTAVENDPSDVLREIIGIIKERWL